VLGPVPGVRGVSLATGHGPTGLTLGPYSGKVVADLILGTQPTVDISAFYVTRFAADATTAWSPANDAEWHRSSVKR
jgi:glycine/D-amino acid oxidase-like deaminating enzyme